MGEIMEREVIIRDKKVTKSAQLIWCSEDGRFPKVIVQFVLR